MPKVRQTCTRCSMRRQKCDLKDPCTRCVQSKQEASCSRVWHNGYDARIHRTYPKQNGTGDAALPLIPQAQTATRALSSLPPFPDITLANTSNPAQPLPSDSYAGNERRSPQDSFHGRQTAIGSSPFIEIPSSVMPQPANTNPSSGIQSSPSSSIAGISKPGNKPDQSRDIEQAYLQTLIPTSRQILQLVEYHEAHILWYHGCVHGPTFRMELIKAVQGSDGIQLRNLDLRWCALLFAIMLATMTCASESTVLSWGFSKAQKRYLNKQWYAATMSCLRLGDYTSKPHIYSIQAIQVSNMSAHTIGSSNGQFINFGIALRIAQNLGLSRLMYDTELDSFNTENTDLSQARKDLLIKREMGRRIWMQMCTQDWYSIPSSEMYLINKQHFTTIRPHRIDDETLIQVGDHVPLGIDLGNYLYDIASLMAEFHDSVTALRDPAAQYEQVLKYDLKLRALGTEPFSPSVSSGLAEVIGSQWLRWAKGIACVVHAHKVIMIHRSFLGKSFSDPRFAYTRWASVAASKTILREVDMAAMDRERPAFWNDQAHLVGGGITLCLDLLHRSEAEPEFKEHSRLVDQAILRLNKYDDSTLAVRGGRLLSSLLKEGTAKQHRARHDNTNNSKEPKSPTSGANNNNNNSSNNEGDPNPLAWPLETRQSIDAMYIAKRSSSTVNTSSIDSANSHDAINPCTRQKSGISSSPYKPQQQLDLNPPSIAMTNVPEQQQQLQPPEDFNAMMDSDLSVFNTMNDLGTLSDVPWTDLISEYFPSQAGFEGGFLMEDLLR